MSDFIQKTLSVGSFQCNCQILVCAKSREAILVDPGDEPARILKELNQIEKQLAAPVTVKALFHTHAHFDHVGATRAIKEELIAKGRAAPTIYLHEGDQFIYDMLKKQGQYFGIALKDPAPVDAHFEDEQTLTYGSMKFTVLHTPGHSPGGCCFRMHSDTASGVPETVFTGDTLFRENIGRADLWGGDEAVLVKSIRERLLTLDGDTLAWPGHGLASTIGHEKLNNPYV